MFLVVKMSELLTGVLTAKMTSKSPHNPNKQGLNANEL